MPHGHVDLPVKRSPVPCIYARDHDKLYLTIPRDEKKRVTSVAGGPRETFVTDRASIGLRRTRPSGRHRRSHQSLLTAAGRHRGPVSTAHRGARTFFLPEFPIERGMFPCTRVFRVQIDTRPTRFTHCGRPT